METPFLIFTLMLVVALYTVVYRLNKKHENVVTELWGRYLKIAEKVMRIEDKQANVFENVSRLEEELRATDEIAEITERELDDLNRGVSEKFESLKFGQVQTLELLLNAVKTFNGLNETLLSKTNNMEGVCEEAVSLLDQVVEDVIQLKKKDIPEPAPVSKKTRNQR